MFFDGIRGRVSLPAPGDGNGFSQVDFPFVQASTDDHAPDGDTQQCRDMIEMPHAAEAMTGTFPASASSRV